jgi:hypothetical protein
VIIPLYASAVHVCVSVCSKGYNSVPYSVYRFTSVREGEVILKSYLALF